MCNVANQRRNLSYRNVIDVTEVPTNDFNELYNLNCIQVYTHVS